ncbi:MAG: glycogen/starch synthase, partial [candidate division Zixibacteria bacterium]|nr:glycogen/starch synthase [candidate division Zixibacteria bacterium]
MDKFRILMASSEAGPFARTGGLGDVLAALPDALAALGHEVVVCIPRYGFIDEDTYRLAPLEGAVSIPLDGKTYPVTVETTPHQPGRVINYFLSNDEFFDRSELYRDPDTGKDYKDNDLRFALFGRAVLEVAKKLDWQPDIIHVHDWQAAPVLAYLKTVYADDPFFARAATV